MSQNFIRDYLEFAGELTDAPEVFHQFAAYSILSAVTGKNVYLPFGAQKIYPNLFVVLIAPSSLYRKSTCLSLAKQFIYDVDDSIILPGEFSQEALVKELSVNSTGILFWSEFAAFLGSSEKQYMLGVKEFLTDIYDCPPVYTRKLKSESYRIEDPCVSILAATTLEWFLERTRDGDLRGGFLPRFLWVPAGEKKKCLAIPPEVDNKIRDAILDTLREIRGISGQMRLTDEAKNEYEKWFKNYNKEALCLEHSSILSGFLSRLAIYAIKFAMLNEISSTRSLIISETAMTKAINLVEFLKGNLINIADEDLAFGSFDKAKKAVMKRLKREGGVSRSNLLRGVSPMKARDFEQVITTLVEEEKIRETKEPTAGRTKKVYELDD